jgi:hypothetical protein
MGIIARSEAIQRLQIIVSNVRSAMEAVRADEWEESVLRAEMALDQLQKLTPWLEEASNNAPVRPNVAAQERIGGMGYRGSSGAHADTFSVNLNPQAKHVFTMGGAPETIPMPNRMPPTPLPDRDPTSPRPIQPRPAPVQRKPIITPPPPLPQPPPEEEVTFDLTRMPNQVPYLVECEYAGKYNDCPAPMPLTEAELELAKRFDQLPERLRERIKLKCFETGNKPVTVRLRKGESNG